jgi:hypothetical protein
MLSYIYRLIRDFEQEHGIHPNILYLNDVHARHLKDGFAEEYSYQTIRDLLQMEFVVNKETLHPHVAWTATVIRKVV